MNLGRPKAIIPLMRTTILAIITIATIIAMSTAYTYELMGDFESKYHQVEQTAKLLASSASTPDGVDLVADQVSEILNNDPTIQSIIFYSIDHPLGNEDSFQQVWRTVLFSNSVNINQAVTSRFVGVNSPSQRLPNDLPDDVALENNTLLGYISITVDVRQYRKQWIIEHKFSWLWPLLITLVSAMLILRLLHGPLEQFARLARVSEEVVADPTISQLPAVQQAIELNEVSQIKAAMIALFSRLEEMRREHEVLKVYEQQLNSKDLSLDAQRMSFQGMITHELKTSLNAIFGGLQLLNNHYLSNEQQDALAIIRKGSQHLDFTLDQIIQLNKIEKGQISLNLIEFNPLRLISDLMREFEPAAKDKGLDLTSQITHVDYLLEGDVGKIKLVLASLLDNAIKFTQKGSIKIESHLNHFDRHTRWSVSVVDTGIGIEERYLEDIFTPFFQVDPSINREFEGVGVGLSLAKRISQLLGASLQVESNVDKGSRFTLVIQLENWHQTQNKHLLSGIKAIFYHQQQQSVLANELAHHGLEITTLQHAQSVFKLVENSAYDLLLISEEVLPKKAMYLAQSIRNMESTNRILIIYLYNSMERIDWLEADIKASGIDYCQDASISSKKLAPILKQWLTL